jgi:hypothetical protein
VKAHCLEPYAGRCPAACRPRSRKSGTRTLPSVKHRRTLANSRTFCDGHPGIFDNGEDAPLRDCGAKIVVSDPRRCASDGGRSGRKPCAARRFSKADKSPGARRRGGCVSRANGSNAALVRRLADDARYVRAAGGGAIWSACGARFLATNGRYREATAPTWRRPAEFHGAVDAVRVEFQRRAALRDVSPRMVAIAKRSAALRSSCRGPEAPRYKGSTAIHVVLPCA